MASVQGYSTDKADAIEDDTVISAELTASGDIVLTTSGGVSFSVGQISKGDSGAINAIASIGSFDREAEDVIIHDWSDGTANVKLSNPASLPENHVRSVAWSPDGRYLALGFSSTSPQFLVYKRDGDTFTRLANPATLPGGGIFSLSWSSDGRYLAMAGAFTPYFHVYKRSGDTLTKLADPGTIPTTTCNGVSWAPDEPYVIVSTNSSPYIHTYFVDSTDFIYKMSNPSVLPPGTVNDVAWSPNGNYVLLAGNNGTPKMTIYKKTGGIGDGSFALTRLSDPTSVPITAMRGASWSPDGIYMALIGNNAAPYFNWYKRTGDVFTKLPDPAVLPGPGWGCGWSPDGEYLALSNFSTSEVQVYHRVGDTLTKIVGPAVSGTVVGYGVGWSPDGIHLVLGHDNSPFVQIFKSAMTPTSNPLLPIVIAP